MKELAGFMCEIFALLQHCAWFGSIHRSHLQGSRSPKKISSMGWITF